ncbi:TetR/AcrR family transcriptional regulator [Oceanobacillus sp. CFH 90083]|uniref:TetR/AcrR family transcriptional regulator n=1 Tax=Oceanobacillus sp. CFH 90083 TaxID=2592336 RepID=UPI00128CAB25|nr:TetR family transcriptional regulator [Oceanobacillus sp. CFH 90083]
MTEEKTDLRILRTRRLIMDAFISLSEKKEFSDIRITDITEEAMINRATFYYHYEDKYDLLEKVLSEVLLFNLDKKALNQMTWGNQAVIQLFTAVADFQNTLSSRCHQGYEETIARIIREHLSVIIYPLLQKDTPAKEEDILRKMAAILSWTIYGASVEWKKSTLSPEGFIKPLLPFILHRLDS